MVDNPRIATKTLQWHFNLPVKKGEMVLLGTGETLKYKVKGGQVEVTLPASALVTGMPVVLKYN